MMVDVLTMLSDEDVHGSKSNSVGGCTEEERGLFCQCPPLRHMQSTNKKKRKQTTNKHKRIEKFKRTREG